MAAGDRPDSPTRAAFQILGIPRVRRLSRAAISIPPLIEVRLQFAGEYSLLCLSKISKCLRGWLMLIRNRQQQITDKVGKEGEPWLKWRSASANSFNQESTCFASTPSSHINR